ncbi:MAG: hypothetical protein U9N76_01890 [Candidatus Marinimicrobia bacterium]|nr:hypothetical protein [Candidatus Neomarinimicrobiota bacterium]
MNEFALPQRRGDAEGRVYFTAKTQRRKIDNVNKLTLPSACSRWAGSRAGRKAETKRKYLKLYYE